MRYRLSLLVVLAALATTATAQLKVHLEFPQPGVHSVWTGTGLPETPPANATKLDGKAFDYDLGTFGPSDRLFVWSAATGNLAFKPIGEIKGTWNVAVEQFQWIGALTVRVEHGGKPVAAAVVKVSDGKRTLERVLDPSSNGELRFAALRPGPITVTVRYNTGGKEADPLKQIVDVQLKRSKADYVAVVSIPDDVPTVGDTAPAQASKPGTAAPAKPQGGSPIGQALVYLLVLAGIGAAGYALLQFLRRNPEAVKERLQKMGVEVPDPKPADPDPADLPPMPRAPEPPQRIILDDAPLDLAAPPIAGPVASGVPRLVGAAGEIALEEGLSVVGREEGLPIALVGESTVSRRHAELVRDGATVTLRDLGSTNGTFVNGAKVDGETTLSNGDDVQFGAVRFRYQG